MFRPDCDDVRERGGVLASRVTPSRARACAREEDVGVRNGAAPDQAPNVIASARGVGSGWTMRLRLRRHRQRPVDAQLLGVLTGQVQELPPGELLDLLDCCRHCERLLGLLRSTAVLVLKDAECRRPATRPQWHELLSGGGCVPRRRSAPSYRFYPARSLPTPTLDSTRPASAKKRTRGLGTRVRGRMLLLEPASRPSYTGLMATAGTSAVVLVSALVLGTSASGGAAVGTVVATLDTRRAGVRETNLCVCTGNVADSARLSSARPGDEVPNVSWD